MFLHICIKSLRDSIGTRQQQERMQQQKQQSRGVQFPAHEAERRWRAMSTTAGGRLTHGRTSSPLKCDQRTSTRSISSAPPTPHLYPHNPSLLTSRRPCQVRGKGRRSHTSVCHGSTPLVLPTRPEGGLPASQRARDVRGDDAAATAAAALFSGGPRVRSLFTLFPRAREGPVSLACSFTLLPVSIADEWVNC